LLTALNILPVVQYRGSTNMSQKCPYSDYCGGCDYQGLQYLQQLDLKQKKVEKLLNKFGKVQPILACETPEHYRNKVQVSFGYDEYQHVICGNYLPNSHFIVPVDDCMICDEKANEIISSIKRLVIKYKINIFDEHALKGCIRHILVRCTNTNEYMVVLVTGCLKIKNQDLFIKDILKYNPCISTLIQNINNKHTSMVLGDKNIVLYGKGYVTDILCDLKFQISPNSFYQVNKTQTQVLYKEAIKAAKLTKSDILLDAYCGTGTIGLIMASSVKQVIGVELNRNAIKDAIKNMHNNKIENVIFIGDDASNYAIKMARQKQRVDVVVMDPPRNGSDIRFMKAVVNLSANRLVYVSCNPTTLADNLVFLSKYYKVNNIQPVDMFPYTEHIETVVALERK